MPLVGMESIMALLTAGAVFFMVTMGGFGTIDTGNVGVHKRFGTVSMAEIEPGIYYAPLADVQNFSAKEIAVELDDMRPKAADNLFIRQFDLTVYYRVEGGRIAETETKYAGMSEYLYEEGVYAPAYRLVQTLTRNAAYEEVAKLDSLTVHQRREEIAVGIRQKLQSELDASDPGTFAVTRVVVRTVVTDPSIEAAIQAAVNNQKKLEAMEIAVRIAEREAEVRLQEARGIAEANKAINNTLTPAYLQHEANKVLMTFAERGGNSTIVLPANMMTTPLLNIPATPQATLRPEPAGAGN